MKRIVIIMLGITLFWGCTEKISPAPESFDALLKEMEGDYVLTGIHWSGSPLDLDGDGTGHNNLIKEFCLFTGYYEPNHFAQVVESNIIEQNDEKTIAISFNLPYPDIKLYDDIPTVTRTKYLPFTVRESYIGGKTQVALTYGPISFEHLNNDEVFLKGISELRITDFSQGEFTVRIRCQMNNFGEKTIKEDYVHYYYKRVN